MAGALRHPLGFRGVRCSREGSEPSGITWPEIDSICRGADDLHNLGPVWDFRLHGTAKFFRTFNRLGLQTLPHKAGLHGLLRQYGAEGVKQPVTNGRWQARRGPNAPAASDIKPGQPSNLTAWYIGDDWLWLARTERQRLQRTSANFPQKIGRSDLCLIVTLEGIS